LILLRQLCEKSFSSFWSSKYNMTTSQCEDDTRNRQTLH